ncbi:MAG: zf-HC2 domain-containing protein [Burkholderiales bacterium]
MGLFRRLIGHLAMCKEVSHLLSQSRENPLSPWQQAKVRWHLAVCSMCSAFERQLALLDAAMRRYRE